jgi:hypothetical protein
MIEFIYNACLLHNNNEKKILFDIVKMQINDTLILINDVFAIAKEKTIKMIDIKIKSRNKLALEQVIKFNETVIK